MENQCKIIDDFYFKNEWILLYRTKYTISLDLYIFNYL